MKAGSVPTIFKHPVVKSHDHGYSKHPQLEGMEINETAIENKSVDRTLNNLDESIVDNQIDHEEIVNDVKFNFGGIDDQSSCHKCYSKDQTFKTFKNDNDNLLRGNNHEILSLKIQVDNHKRYEKELLDKIKSLELEAKSLKEKKTPSFLNPDQLLYHPEHGMKGRSWSEKTLKTGIQLKNACGTSGYNLLIEKGYPLPAAKTIQQRVSHIDFDVGVLKEVFPLLKQKINILPEDQRICAMYFDEMAITSKMEYDIKSDSIIGSPTISPRKGNTPGDASKAIVFMIGGVNQRWKQVVAYHFIDTTVDSDEIHKVIIDIIEECYKIGLIVISLSTDMGGPISGI